MSSKELNIKLKTYSDLFQSSEKPSEVAKIVEIRTSEIDEFPNHPFKVINDAEMDKLVDSIKDNGLITPVIVRKVNDRYQMISGHRRLNACKLLGKETIKANVVNVSDDEATIMMVEANYQRPSIKLSEKAFAYKMRLDALNRQGKRTDLTLSQLETKLNSGTEIANNTDDSRTQIYRIVRLTNLIPQLLELVDQEKLKLIPAVELSYIDMDSQLMIYECISELGCPSNVQATKLKEFAKTSKLTKQDIQNIMTKSVKQKSFNIKKVEKYIPKEIVGKNVERYIIEALKYYQDNHK